MKQLIFAAFMMISLSVSATDYQCFSYNTYEQMRANSDTGTIIIKDRFGNELDTILKAATNFRILSTVPVTLQLQFMKHNKIILHIEEQGEFIRAIYGDDESYHCRVLVI